MRAETIDIVTEKMSRTNIMKGQKKFNFLSSELLVFNNRQFSLQSRSRLSYDLDPSDSNTLVVYQPS